MTANRKLIAYFQCSSLSPCSFDNGGYGRIGFKSVGLVSFGTVCCCSCRLTILVLGKAKIRVTVFVLLTCFYATLWHALEQFLNLALPLAQTI